MDMETIGGSRTRNNEAPLLLLCRCATIVLKTRIFLPPNLSLSGPVTRIWIVVSIRTLPVALAQRGLGVGHLGFDGSILPKVILKIT